MNSEEHRCYLEGLLNDKPNNTLPVVSTVLLLATLAIIVVLIPFIFSVNWDW